PEDSRPAKLPRGRDAGLGSFPGSFLLDRDVDGGRSSFRIRQLRLERGGRGDCVPIHPRRGTADPEDLGTFASQRRISQRCHERCAYARRRPVAATRAATIAPKWRYMNATTRSDPSVKESALGLGAKMNSNGSAMRTT